MESTFDTKASSQNRVDDVKGCPSCKEKDSKNLELTEALSRQTALVTAEMISTMKENLQFQRKSIKI